MTISSNGGRDGNRDGNRDGRNYLNNHEGKNNTLRAKTGNNSGNKNMKISRSYNDLEYHSEDTGPSAPSPGLVLFNSEEQSDMVFNVGTDASDMWRIPAHSFVVSGASPVFQAIIDSRQNSLGVNYHVGNKKPEIQVYCQPELFQAMLCYIYKNEVNLTSVTNTLNLLPVANQFKLHGLIRSCLQFLQQEARPKNVCEILSFLRRLTPSSNPPPYTSNPDVLVDNSNRSQKELEASITKSPSHFCFQGIGMYPTFDSVIQAENLLNELIIKCYEIIDVKAEDILGREDILESLDQSLLTEILSRDTLCLSSETTAFDCLLTWACQQCLKQRLPVTGGNKRCVLDQAIYAARYLVMPMEEFMRGPYSSDILTEEEKSYLLSRLRKDVCLDIPPKELVGRKLDVPRKGKGNPHGKGSCDCKKKSKKRSCSESAVGEVKRKSASKKLMNGLSGFMICVIQLLD